MQGVVRSKESMKKASFRGKLDKLKKGVNLDLVPSGYVHVV